ncbi:MAG TPA: amino acid adenylation domain-containing protein, partial [Rhodocyclaceae bacterium]|nr:amino acid adenylation domain-containing protein [Rhodocyclaceae bacterium]
TGFNVLLSRYCGQMDINVGSIVASGDHAASESFSNVLVMRNDLSDNPGFTELLQRTGEVARQGHAHRDMPFAYLTKALGHARSRSHAMLVQVCFLVQPSPFIPMPLSDLALRNMDGEHAEQFDLVLQFDDDDALNGAFCYSSDLFKPSTIERMAGHLKNLFQAVLDDPSARIGDLPILTDAEYQQIVVDWNATTAACPHACVHELFERQVEKTPDAPAVVFEDQSLTYAALNAKANQLAHCLIAKGVGPDVLVGLCAKRSLEMVIGLLGILKAGGAYVPLDPAYPTDRLAYMIDDARPALVLCQEALLGHLKYDGINTVCLDRDWLSISHSDSSNPVTRALPQTLAYVIYTSGSTGKPKGVALAHQGLCNLCLAQADAFEVENASQVLQFASISFDAAVSEAFVTLTQGACLHLLRQEALRSTYEITKLLEKSAITVVTLPPSLLAVLPQKSLPALKTLVLAGEAWPPELARIWARGRRMLNAYGPTEATVCATWNQVDASVEHTVPIGRPLANTHVYILNERLVPTPTGVPGELYVSGIGLARGYLNRPDLTAERFVANPFSSEPGARMYRTGDKARYLEDGNIEFLGRVDSQVKLRGYRIELGEIEATLIAHEAVKDAAVMVREDHPGEKRLVAYIVVDSEVSAQALKVHLKASLPDYMLPQSFIFLDAMPVSPNGKLDRRALPKPNTDRPDRENLAVPSAE